MTYKFEITPLLMEFSHEITKDKLVILRTKADDRTLIKQIEDEINNQIDMQLQQELRKFKEGFDYKK